MIESVYVLWMHREWLEWRTQVTPDKVAAR